MASRRGRILGKYDGRKLFWFRAARRFLLLLLAVYLVFRFVIGFSAVSGISMLDTLRDGDLVLYTRINGEIERGDIISVGIPSGEYYVKRVVALGGDVVDIRGGALYVNGEMEAADYVRGATYPEAGSFTYPYTVAPGDAFVLGDNREESIDSRFFGAVNLRQVKGVLRVRMGLFYIEFL